MQADNVCYQNNNNKELRTWISSKAKCIVSPQHQVVSYKSLIMIHQSSQKATVIDDFLQLVYSYCHRQLEQDVIYIEKINTGHSGRMYVQWSIPLIIPYHRTCIMITHIYRETGPLLSQFGPNYVWIIQKPYRTLFKYSFSLTRVSVSNE